MVIVLANTTTQKPGKVCHNQLSNHLNSPILKEKYFLFLAWIRNTTLYKGHWKRHREIFLKSKKKQKYCAKLLEKRSCFIYTNFLIDKSDRRIRNIPCELTKLGALNSGLLGSTHFKPMLHFYNPWKLQKITCFLTFSADIEMEHWLEVG